MPKHPSALITRRQALKTVGAGVVLTGLAALTGRALAAKPAAPLHVPVWELPKLVFEYNALEPHIDALTMQIHHSKHHQAYINNAKALLDPHPNWRSRTAEYLVRNIETVPTDIRTGIRNNAGGHVNHSFFWTILAPGAGGEPVNTSASAIAANFGSFVDFKKQFADAAMKCFGSGWTWLVAQDGKLAITTTANQDSPLSTGAVSLLGLDVWEHAYYLHYQNRRTDYITAFWNVVNWPQVELYYQTTLKT